MGVMEIEDGIRTILREQAAVEVASVDEDLIAGGIMDSLTFVDMLFHIEQLFGVRLELETLGLDDLRTVGRLAAAVAARAAAL